MIIGIDVGGSTTKIIGIEGEKVKAPQFITAADPITSLFGAFGKYVYDNRIDLSTVEQVMLTGVGSACVDGDLYGLPTGRADEFMSNALGARFRSGLSRMIVVSMGTGTSFIKIDGPDIAHIGGMAIGGGTLQGLSRILFHTHDVRNTVGMSMKGDTSRVDLRIKDISRSEIPGLPEEVTASNFGKADSDAAPEDVAAGIVIHPQNPDGYVCQPDKGYVAYADSTDNPHGNNGIIYLGMVFPQPLSHAAPQWFTPDERKQHGGALGHVLGIGTYQPDSTWTYYWGSGWSKAGIGSMEQWNACLEDFAKKLQTPLRITVE